MLGSNSFCSLGPGITSASTMNPAVPSVAASGV